MDLLGLVAKLEETAESMMAICLRAGFASYLTVHTEIVY